jgi:hypothetical protein
MLDPENDLRMLNQVNEVRGRHISGYAGAFRD